MKPTKTSKREPVSKLYARALFEYASEKNALEAVKADLEGLIETLQADPELLRAMSGFMFPVAQRGALLKDLVAKMQLHPILANTMDLLLSKNRLHLLEPIHEGLQELLDESRNVVRGVVRSATALAEAEKTEIEEAFSRKLKKQVHLKSVVDSNLLGGVIVQIHGLTYDGSLRTTIQRLKENLERQSI